MGSNLSKFRKHIISGDEYAAIQLYTHNGDLHKGLDPNISYGDNYDQNTPMHYVAKHAMKSLLRIFLAELGGNPNKKNCRNESVLHALCSVDGIKPTMVQQRKRVECLMLILQWSGPTLRDGRVEKADLAAIDEKENTALHYAAYSGIQKMVEMLVLNGAPLFAENVQKETPCDCAEKMGHDGIALYLESKMVFSDDDQKPEESELMNSYDMDEGYSGLRAQDLQEAKDQLLVETSDMLHVPLFTAEALLRNHEWSREMLLESWIRDPIACCEKCGVTPPVTLFPEWMGSTNGVGASGGQSPPSCDVELKSPTAVSAPMSFEAVCGICTCTISHLEEPVPMPCGHQYCRKCWEMYLNGKIAAGEAHNVTCAGYMCNKLVPVDIIETLVSRDMATRYLQFDIKAFVESNPSIKWCPHPGCGRAVRLPEAQKLVSPTHRTSGFVSSPSETSHAVDCGNGHTFCWECLGEAHEPASCENWKNWYSKIAEIKPEELTGTDEKTENSANCLWLVTNSKPCPNCKSPIQKNEGCNHMKCSKCKHDFCWVCLEPWKKHSTATGGYFRCNRYEVVKKVEEQQDVLKAEAEAKNKRMQELNKFVHYYSRFKNHENSYKLEEPLFDTAREKMMILARAVTSKEADINVGTKFIQDAVVQLLKARHVLKCSYAFGYYLEDTGYKKPIFEFMQTELEECTESLSEMVARPFLRTPRNKIVQTAILVQRKRHEFVSAIGKGLVPPDTSPERERRKIFNYRLDDETKKALMASLEEDPNALWVKDPSGRHTNVSALFDWPEESDESDSEIPSPSKFPSALSSLVSSSTNLKAAGGVLGTSRGCDEGDWGVVNPLASSSVPGGSGSEISASVTSFSDSLPGKCARTECQHLQVRNPRTGEFHQHCSMRCMKMDQIGKQQGRSDSSQKPVENLVDFNMDLMRALEMSRLQYIRETGSSVDEDAETRPPVEPLAPSSSASTSQQHLATPELSGNMAQLVLREDEKQMSVAIELSMEEYLKSASRCSSEEEETKASRRDLKSKSCETLSSTAFADDKRVMEDGEDNGEGEGGRMRIHSDQEPQPFLEDSRGRWGAGGQLSQGCGLARVDSRRQNFFSQHLCSKHQQDCGYACDRRPSQKCFVENFDASPHSQAFYGRSRGASGRAESKYFGLVKDIDVANISAPEADKTIGFKSKDFKNLFFEDGCSDTSKLSKTQQSYAGDGSCSYHSSNCRKARSSSNGPTDRKKTNQQALFIGNGKRPVHLHSFYLKLSGPDQTADKMTSSRSGCPGGEPILVHKHKSRVPVCATATAAHYHPRQHNHHHHHKNLCGQSKCNFTKDETVVSVLDVWHHIPHVYGGIATHDGRVFNRPSCGDVTDKMSQALVERVATADLSGDFQSVVGNESRSSPRRKSASAAFMNGRSQDFNKMSYFSRGRSENSSHLLLPWSSSSPATTGVAGKLNSEEDLDPVDMVISPRILESLLQGAEGYPAPLQTATAPCIPGGRHSIESNAQASSSTSNLLSSSSASGGKLKPAMFSFPDMTSLGNGINSGCRASHSPLAVEDLTSCRNRDYGFHGKSTKAANVTAAQPTKSHSQVFVAPPPSSTSSLSSKYVIRSFQSTTPPSTLLSNSCRKAEKYLKVTEAKVSQEACRHDNGDGCVGKDHDDDNRDVINIEVCVDEESVFV